MLVEIDPLGTEESRKVMIMCDNERNAELHVKRPNEAELEESKSPGTLNRPNTGSAWTLEADGVE